jgi:diketogulonate reductase-like aldo/keto reductase
MQKSGLARSDIFFTTKVPFREMGYEPAKAAIESSFKETGLDYIDL